jgi:ABC-2 type transport system ATP-binding protein
MSISVKNLTKNYGNQKAVNHISFEVGKGEIVGFLGPNGAGKSTTMKIITGYLAGDGGTVCVDGLQVHPDAPATKKKIGYLPEQNPLYYDMYVREYLHFIGGIHQVQAIAEKVETVIATVGLTPEANKRISQLSKGYKQRVGLAAALIHDPEVLILDEPTTGLDPNQIVEIREVIKKLGQNKTVLFSSHILQEVEAICDRVIIINKGNIVADDSLKHLQKGTQSGHAVTVTFKETVDKAVLDKVVTGTVQQLAGGAFQIETTTPEDVKKQLMNISLQQNLEIVSLQSSTQNSLEDIFRQLTGA